MLGIMDIIAAIVLAAAANINVGIIGVWFCMYLVGKGFIFLFMGNAVSTIDIACGLLLGFTVLHLTLPILLYIAGVYLFIKGVMSIFS